VFISAKRLEASHEVIFLITGSNKQKVNRWKQGEDFAVAVSSRKSCLIYIVRE
jgi:hypothetical protein